ncbi:MAG TPA: RNA polymerase sigma-70 factor [Lapillicoccus sp.]|nr:RNA polymerase sigma-70 factor [Lapillicoccus sp.]
MPDSEPTGEETLAREFEELRPQLVGAAYRILGSVADAEDAVQETWLRWAAANRDEVRDPRAYLLTAATRQALNRVRQQQHRREDYVGPWLPEPVATDRGPAESVELADSVSMAMLVVLESLSPLERAAFVLHDVFGLSFAEVATTLDRSEAAVRQLANRARGHVHSRRPDVVDRSRHEAVLDQFATTLMSGDMDAFMALLAPDVVLVSDGGGVKRAALRPIHGPEKIVRWLLGVLNRPDYEGETRIEMTRLNDETAVLLYAAGELDTVAYFTVEDRGITAIYFIRNPYKLTHVTGEAATLVD